MKYNCNFSRLLLRNYGYMNNILLCMFTPTQPYYFSALPTSDSMIVRCVVDIGRFLLLFFVAFFLPRRAF